MTSRSKVAEYRPKKDCDFCGAAQIEPRKSTGVLAGASPVARPIIEFDFASRIGTKPANIASATMYLLLQAGLEPHVELTIYVQRVIGN